MKRVPVDYAFTEEEAELRKYGYSLGAKIGEGSFAKVKSAYSDKHQKKVAIKIINLRRSPKYFREKFLPRELEVLKTLDSPYCIGIYDLLEFNHKVRKLFIH